MTVDANRAAVERMKVVRMVFDVSSGEEEEEEEQRGCWRAFSSSLPPPLRLRFIASKARDVTELVENRGRTRSFRWVRCRFSSSHRRLEA